MKISAFHGSGTRITAFDYAFTDIGNDQLGSGFYFTTSEIEARGYCHNRMNFKHKPGGHTEPTVHHVEVTLQKPLMANTQLLLSADMIDRIVRSSPILHEQLNNFWGEVDVDGEDRLMADVLEAYTHQEPSNLIQQLNSLSTDFFPGHMRAFFDAIKSTLGYDGVRLKLDGHEHVVAWFPEQINIIHRHSLMDELTDEPVGEEPDIKGGMPLFHGTEYEFAMDIVDNGIDLGKCTAGYFGQGFYCTHDYGLAASNYANMADKPAIVGMRLIRGHKILDLRSEADFNFWQQHNLDRQMGSPEFPQIMKKLGIDGLYDRSFDGVVIYNPRAVEVVGLNVPNGRKFNRKL